MAGDKIPVSLPNVAAVRERFQEAMDDVRRKVNALGEELRLLEIYARERSEEVRGQYQNTEASRAYGDMADRIQALRGEG